MFIDELDDIVNKYDNTYHSTIKMKPANVNSSTYIDLKVENNNKDSKFKIGDHFYLNIETFLQKVTTQYWSEEHFVIKKVENTVP